MKIIMSLFLSVVLFSNSANSQEVFYSNKRIEFIVGQKPGGTYDRWARSLGKYMGNHIPGNPSFIVKNMPGAHHKIAANYIFNIAEKDGTTIGTISPSIPIEELTQRINRKFNVREFNWIGSPEQRNSICIAKAGVVRGAEDLFKKELIFGAPKNSVTAYTTPIIINKTIGMKMRVITGYTEPNDVLFAMERNEVQGLCLSVAGLGQLRPDWVERKSFVVLFNLERKPIEKFNSPSIYDFLRTQNQKQIFNFFLAGMNLGRPIVAPPKVPAERVGLLRTAFAEVMKNPEFIKFAEKQNLQPNYIGHKEMEDVLDNLSDTPQKVIESTKQLLKK